MVGEYASGHPNHVLLNDHADSISRCNNREGMPYRIVRIPMPWSMSNAPPSYLNSLFVNNKVLVPLWNEPEDDTALFIYEQALPGYDVVGINCSQMSGSGGAIHCITMQAPSPYFIHVQHYPLINTEDTLNPYRVRARLTTSSNLLAESTLVFYKINSGSYNTTPLSTVVDTPGVYAGYIPAQSGGDTVSYYILAKNNDGIRRTSPVHVPPQIYTFLVTGNPYIAEQNISNPVFVTLLSSNPVRSSLRFSILLEELTNVKIEIYNVMGQRMHVVIDKSMQAGNHEIHWDFCDKMNRELAQGAYFYRVVTEGETKTGKVLFIK